jgi:hypothetical protein
MFLLMITELKQGTHLYKIHSMEQLNGSFEHVMCGVEGEWAGRG